MKSEKAIRRFSSLEVWQRFRKSRSLELKGLKVKWLNRINVRRLSWDFISTDFIKNLVPYCPVLDLLHARGVSPTALRACRLNPLAIRISSVRKSASILELKGLKVKWLNRINVRRLSWDFISTDFITPFNLLTIKPFNPKALAFTMAEILISLTIIGVIAAITLPALRANINESSWATQRKALYSRMSQAIAMMPSLNGYGEYVGSWSADSVSVTKDTAALAFVTDGLAKVLKITNICDSNNLQKCGLPEKITTMPIMYTNKTSKIDFPTKLSELNTGFTSGFTDAAIPNNPQKYIDTVAAAFETKNGESIAVFYNPLCLPFINMTEEHYSQPKMCADFVYDLNGTKDPNKVGKDIGYITAIYSVDSSVVAPVLTRYFGDSNYNLAEAIRFCRAKGAKLPNIEELLSLFYNCKLMNLCSNGHWSSTKISSGTAWGMGFYQGVLNKYYTNTKTSVRCIER